MANKKPNPVFEIEHLNPVTLTPNPANPKVHTARQKQAVAASLEEFGWLSAPIWNKRTGLLVDGHARVEQAQIAGVASIPVRVIDVDENTERRILAAFDRVGELRAYDDDALASLLSHCSAMGEVMPGWTDDEIGDLLRKVEGPIAATEPTPVTAPGVEAPSGLGEVGSEGSAEPGPAEVRQVSAVRMVQLFFGPEEHEAFEFCVGVLAEEWQLNTPSDVVLNALRNASENGK